MMARLFEVTVEVKLFVAAEDADDAAEWAETNADEWWPDVSEGSAYAREATRVPTGHGSDFPWLADGVVADDRCIAEWIEGGE